MSFYFMRASERQQIPGIMLERHMLSFKNVGVFVFSSHGYPSNTARIYANSRFLFKKVMNIKHLKNLIRASYEWVIMCKLGRTARNNSKDEMQKRDLLPKWSPYKRRWQNRRVWGEPSCFWDCRGGMLPSRKNWDWCLFPKHSRYPRTDRRLNRDCSTLCPPHLPLSFREHNRCRSHSS